MPFKQHTAPEGIYPLPIAISRADLKSDFAPGAVHTLLHFPCCIADYGQRWQSGEDQYLRGIYGERKIALMGGDYGRVASVLLTWEA